MAVEAGGNQRAVMGGQAVRMWECVSVCVSVCVQAPLWSGLCDRPTVSSSAPRVCQSDCAQLCV